MTTQTLQPTQRRFGAITFVRTLERQMSPRNRHAFRQAMARYISAATANNHVDCHCMQCNHLNREMTQAAINMSELLPSLDSVILATLRVNHQAISEALARNQPASRKVA